MAWRQWSAAQVGKWVGQQGDVYGQFSKRFISIDVTGADLPGLNEEDLDALGIKGHILKKKFLKQIKKLTAGGEEAPPRPPSGRSNTRNGNQQRRPQSAVAGRNTTQARSQTARPASARPQATSVRPQSARAGKRPGERPAWRSGRPQSSRPRPKRSPMPPAPTRPASAPAGRKGRRKQSVDMKAFADMDGWTGSFGKAKRGAWVTPWFVGTRANGPEISSGDVITDFRGKSYWDRTKIKQGNGLGGKAERGVWMVSGCGRWVVGKNGQGSEGCYTGGFISDFKGRDYWSTKYGRVAATDPYEDLKRAMGDMDDIKGELRDVDTAARQAGQQK